MKEKVWKLYLRFSKQWFTPCKECQKNIEEDFKKELHEYGISAMEVFIGRINYVLCSECKKKIIELLEDADIILGNKDYEPFIEASRK